MTYHFQNPLHLSCMFSHPYLLTVHVRDLTWYRNASTLCLAQDTVVLRRVVNHPRMMIELKMVLARYINLLVRLEIVYLAQKGLDCCKRVNRFFFCKF